MKGFTMKEAQRAYVYRVFLALVPLLVLAGVIVGGEEGLYIGLAGAILGVPSGLATANTDRKSNAL